MLIEKLIEKTLFSSRWIMAPMYLGLAVALFVLLLKFFQEVFHYGPLVGSMSEAETVIWILSLVDIALIGNLLVIVIFSGYENFVSRIDIAQQHPDRPSWMGKVDYSGLKLKLISSIMAISAIELLRAFMRLSAGGADAPSNTVMAWLVGIHVVFVISGVLFALSDRLAGHSSHD